MNETVQITHGRAWVDADNGVRLGYTDARTTEQPLRSVLLLHGAPQTRYFWRHVIEPLALAGYRVIAPDYRGAGESSKPLAGYDKWTMAGDIHTLVRETLGVKGPISIVGHDLGSMLAFAYALRYRDEISTATFMEGPLPGTEYYKRRVVAKSAWHFDFHSHPDIAVYLTQGRERWYIQRFFDELTYRTDAISQTDVDVYARAFEAPGAMRALFEIYRELDRDAEINASEIARNGQLTIPVLAAGGAELWLSKNYLSMCEEIAVNVTSHLIPECGHWVAEEQPELFVQMFLDFDQNARVRSP